MTGSLRFERNTVHHPADGRFYWWAFTDLMEERGLPDFRS